eukprot:429254_1
MSVSWISCHKDESEMLLVDQYLPIEKSMDFTSNERRVDHLLFKLTIYKNTIDQWRKHEFWKQIGFKVNSEMISIIRKHPVLYKELDPVSKTKVIDRLINELQIYKLNTKHIWECVETHPLFNFKSYKMTRINTYFDKGEYEYKRIAHDGQEETFTEKDIINVANDDQYRYYAKNKDLFGDKYYLIQTQPNDKMYIEELSLKFQNKLYVDNSNSIVFKDDNSIISSENFQKQLPRYLFCLVTNDIQYESNLHYFEKFSDIKIPLVKRKNNILATKNYLFVEIKNSIGAVLVKGFDVIYPKYVFDLWFRSTLIDNPIQLSRSRSVIDNHSIFQIISKKNIEINANAGIYNINDDITSMWEDEQKLMDEKHEEKTELYVDTDDKKLVNEGKIIFLYSHTDIEINGELKAHTILIFAKNNVTVSECGSIECGNGGRVIICCESFKNVGNIKPEPISIYKNIDETIEKGLWDRDYIQLPKFAQLSKQIK